MSGLFASLNNTVQAMSAQSRAIEITGKNMANVDNPNYSRESILLGSRGTLQTPQGPESMGVAALGLQQMRDSLLDQQVVSQVALTAGYTTQQQAYQRAQAALGQSVGGAQSTSGASSVSSGGLGASMDDFFNAFQSLAARPTDPGQRQVLLQNASILTDRLHQTNQSLARVSADLTTQVGTDVTTVNGLLQAVADLSKQIARLEINNPGSAVDLRDQRQTDIEQLAAKLPVSTQTTATGQFQVYAKDSLGNQVILVDGANVPGPVAVTGSQVTGGSGATALTLSGGSIQGAISARDGAIKTLSDNLDQLAAQLVAAVNKAYNPTGTTGDFFTASGTTAATIAVASGVNATTLKASDGGAAGDNTIALAVAGVATKTFSTSGGDAIDGTLGSFYATAVSNVGQAVAGATSRLTDQSHIEAIVRSQRDAVSGVSIDEEAANLLKYQRAYQASARVFTIIDNLMGSVINLGMATPV